MSAGDLERAFGAAAFGANPRGYDEARPEYPAWVFDRLAGICGLGPGAEVFEIGAGTGIATRALLARGAGRVVAIEPDPRLGAFLRARVPDPRLEIRAARFDETSLPPASFDLGVCATAFHWLEEDDALAQIAAALKPGGWWTPFWHVFGDPTRHDAFHEATRDIFHNAPRSPSDSKTIPYALDVAARTGALARSGRFDDVTHHQADWTLTLTAAETMRLYATYSNVQARADREEVLRALHQIARVQFDDRVVRNMTTILYCARRRA